MKRVLCLILTLALSLGLCGAAAAYEGETPIVQEPVTLTVFTHSGVNASYPPPSNDLMFWQYMEELTGVHIEWEAVASESYEEIIATRLAAGVDLPDIMNVSSQSNAINAGRNGLLLDMKPLLEENGHWINKLFAENDFAKALMTL